MKLVVLDRDGVINEDSEAYIKSPEEWVPIKGSIEAIARLNGAGYRVVVVTNQSGIGRGLFDIEALHRIHEKMRALLARNGGHVDAVAFCPHRPEDGCECRKPRPGMLLDIASRLRISLEEVPVIGDSLRDIEAALEAGGRPMLVRTGNGRHAEQGVPSAVEVFDDLSGAVNWLLEP